MVAEANCDLLLDVNNVYVNSINHGYDPKAFIDGIDASRVHYMHIAGHYEEAEDLRVDTHGSDVTEDVWDLLDHAYAHVGVVPTLLERDFNIPSMHELKTELSRIRKIQSQHAKTERAANV